MINCRPCHFFAPVFTSANCYGTSRGLVRVYIRQGSDVGLGVTVFASLGLFLPCSDLRVAALASAVLLRPLPFASDLILLNFHRLVSAAQATPSYIISCCYIIFAMLLL